MTKLLIVDDWAVDERHNGGEIVGMEFDSRPVAGDIITFITKDYCMKKKVLYTLWDIFGHKVVLFVVVSHMETVSAASMRAKDKPKLYPNAYP